MSDVTKEDLREMEARVERMLQTATLPLSNGITELVEQMRKLNGRVVDNAREITANRERFIRLEEHDRAQERVQDAVEKAMQNSREDRTASPAGKAAPLESVKVFNQNYGSVLLLALGLMYILAHVLGAPLPLP